MTLNLAPTLGASFLCERIKSERPFDNYAVEDSLHPARSERTPMPAALNDSRSQGTKSMYLQSSTSDTPRHGM